MTASPSTPATDADVARLAYAIWEAEGRPEARDEEHWFRAKELVEGGSPESDPDATAEAHDDTGTQAARPVQPGDEDAPAEESAETSRPTPDTPGHRNPTPIPPTNKEGYVSIPSADDATGRALNDEPASRPANDEQQGQPRRRRAKPKTLTQ